MTDERYQKIMADLGMPNSRSLLSALQQVANEVEQATRSALTNAHDSTEALRLALGALEAATSAPSHARLSAPDEAKCVVALAKVRRAPSAPAAPSVPAGWRQVAWGVFAKVDGEWSLQWPPRITHAAAEDDIQHYKPGTPLKVLPIFAAAAPQPGA